MSLPRPRQPSAQANPSSTPTTGPAAAGSWRNAAASPVQKDKTPWYRPQSHHQQQPATDPLPATQESRTPLWVSPAIPDWLMGRLIGPKGAHLLSLQHAFKPLCVRMRTINGDAQGRSAFCVFPPGKQMKRPAHPAMVEKLVAQLKRLLTEVLNVPRCPMPRNLTYSVVETSVDSLLEWKVLPESMAKLTPELDFDPPFFFLSKALPVSQQSLVNSKLLPAVLDDDSNVNNFPKPRTIQLTSSIDSEMADLATRIVDTYRTIASAYDSLEVPDSHKRFRLIARFACNVYTAQYAQHMYEVGTVMTVGDLLAAHETQEIRSMFMQAYPLDTFPAVMHALDRAGFQQVTQDVEKVAVAFRLSHEYIADHFARVGIRTIPGYSPTHEFKVTFMWSPAISRFVPSNQGVRYYINDQMVRHTWITPAAASTSQVPIMPRVRFGYAHANYKCEAWQLATGLVGAIGEYVNANLIGIRTSKPGLALPKLPEDLRYALLAFRLRHKLVTRLLGPINKDFPVSVKRTVMFFQVQDKRPLTWEVPVAQTRFVAFAMMDREFGEREKVVGQNEGAVKAWLEVRVNRFCRMAGWVNGVLASALEVVE